MPCIGHVLTRPGRRWPSSVYWTQNCAGRVRRHSYKPSLPVACTVGASQACQWLVPSDSARPTPAFAALTQPGGGPASEPEACRLHSESLGRTGFGLQLQLGPGPAGAAEHCTDSAAGASVTLRSLVLRLIRQGQHRPCHGSQ